MKYIKKYHINESLGLETYNISDFLITLTDLGYSVSVFYTDDKKDIMCVVIKSSEYKEKDFHPDKLEAPIKERVEQLIPILIKKKCKLNRIECSINQINTFNDITGTKNSSLRKYVTGINNKLHILSKYDIYPSDITKHYALIFDFSIAKL